MKTPILGSSYAARSVNAADNRMVNLFPEMVPEGGKEPAFLQRAPGLVSTSYITTSANVAVRGLHVYTFNQVEYLVIVCGQQVYTSAAGAVAVYRGNISASIDTQPVYMANNGTQVYISDSRLNTGWILDMAAFTLTQVAGTTLAPNFIGSGTVTYLDGFFIFNVPGTQKIYSSNLLNGLVIDALDFASAEASPDLVVSVIAIGGELWVMGANSTEVWYNAGTAGFPFAPVQGAFNEVGCASAGSVCKLDNSVFWLGKDARGEGIVFRSKGYGAERISTHAIEYAIQQYTTVADAVAYAYQQDGHLFYVITFPTASTTWVYDVSTQAWHERAAWTGSAFARHRGNCAAFYQNKTIVGDYSNRLVYEMDTDIYDDNGTESKWLRSWRALATGQNNLTRSAHHSLQLDCETGVGNGADPDPQVTLKWSDDGGHTWSTGSAVSMGAAAAYGTRVIWRRLGMTMKLRDRVYEVSGTDKVKIIILGAELHASATNA